MTGQLSTDSHAFAQALHDLSGALWFGGSVAGVAGYNKAGADLPDPYDRIRVAGSAWSRFAPAQWAAIGVHTLAGLQLTRASKGRLALQHGYGRAGTVKAAVTAAGIGATAYAAFTGAKVSKAAQQARARGQQVQVADANISTDQTPPEVARWQRQNRVAQYLVPALTGANVVLGSYLVQAYRPGAAARGFLQRLNPFD